MPFSGYIRKRPDTQWWLEQIKAGDNFRKKFAYESEWPKWRDYYRGNWSKNIMPVNLFFTMMRTTVPRIYFRNPAVSITPGKAGLLNLAFARIIERTDNKLMKRMRFKQTMKRIVRDNFMFGTGVPKLGFGGFYSPTTVNELDEIPLSKQGHAVEYYQFAENNMPWIGRVRPDNFTVQAGLETWEHARWTAEYIERDINDVRDDPRFENTSQLRPSRREETYFGNIQRPVNLVRLYEVRDRKTGKVFVFSPDKGTEDKVLLFEDDMFQRYGGLPYFPTIFNEDDEAMWGVPDSKILEPYQLELNEIRTQIMKHRRLTLVKVLVQEKKMDVEEAEKLVSEDVGAVAFVKGDPNTTVKIIQQSTIPQELFKAAEEVMSDVRETMAFSRNQMGEFNSGRGDTTATEATIVRLATEIRVDERRDSLADTTVDIIERMHAVIFDNWGAEEVIDVLGPGGIPIWVQFRGDLLKTGRYNINVDPDSTVPETRALREQRAIQLYTILKENPLIDPMKLTQYLLKELKGVQFDDMMKMLPAPEGGIPNRPVTPGDFANLIGQSVSQVSRPGGSKPRVSPPTINQKVQ